MKLHEFLEELALGELMDTSMSVNGEIKDDKQPNIVIKLNDVLNHLHTKYIMKLVPAYIDTFIKELTYTYVNPNSVQIVYVRPTEWDYSKIYHHHEHMVIRGNTISFNVKPTANLFDIWYQWKPTRLNINPAKGSFLDQEVNMPDTLRPLVRTLVAAQVFMSMNGELHKKTAVELTNLAQYMMLDLEHMSILNTSVDYQNNQFFKNGFK